MPKAVTSLEGYIRKLKHLGVKHPNSQLLFRGHSDILHEIRPSVYRNENHKKSEHLMIRQLLAQHPSEFQSDKNIFDQLVRAQHYGLPTRLLDVSLNPLAALYFAVASNPKKRGQIIVFKPDIQKQKYFDSDTVSLMSSLALLTLGEKREIVASIKKALKNKSTINDWVLIDDDLVEFNESSSIAKLIQLVRHEKPDFRAIVQPTDLMIPVSVVPRQLHKRILAQNGSFILFGLATRTSEWNMKDIEYEVIDIDSESKSTFLKELSQVNVNKSTLFPEIENAAVNIKERYR